MTDTKWWLVVRCIVLAGVIFFMIAGSGSSDPLEEVDSLIEARQYETAFNKLDSLDSENSDPTIVVKKVDLALKYFVKSINHLMFAFTDLGPDDDLDALRDGTGNFTLRFMTPDSILIGLIESHPNDGRLYRALGDYYYEAYSKYGSLMDLDAGGLLAKMTTNYLRADSLGAMTDESLGHLGVAYLTQDRLDDAKVYLEKAIAVNPEYPDAHYNLAYIYFQRRMSEKALPHAEKAYQLYDDPTLKSEAARLTAVCRMDMSDYENAIPILLDAERLAPEDYHNIRNLIWAYLHTGDTEALDSATRKLFSMDPGNPMTIQMILSDYYEAEHQQDIPGVLSKLKAEYQQSPDALGNIFFHWAVYCQDQKQYVPASALLDSAEVEFRKCKDDTSSAFDAIRQYREMLEGR